VPLSNPKIDTVLEPYRNPQLMLAVRCGKCSRLLGSAYPERHLPAVTITRATIPDSSHRGSPSPRPWASFELLDGIELCEGGRGRLICHTNCGAFWVTDNVQLVAAFVTAARAGRDELIFGPDL